MSKDKSIKIFFAVIGTLFLTSIIVGLVSTIGTTSKPNVFDCWSLINVVMFILACHISIEWIKDLFRDE